MRRELLMPKLGLTMTEGTLVEWIARPGTRFAAGATLFVVESEKVATEIEAQAAGTLLETVLPEGETVECGTVVGYWEPAEPAGEAAVPAAPAADAPRGEPAAPAPAPAAPPEPTWPAPSAPSAAPATGAHTRIRATPYARRLARERGVDLAALAGTGPGGRIRARDLPARSPDAAARPGAKTVRPSATQQTIARRMVAAKQQVPHFYLALEAEASALLALRAEFNAGAAGPKVTLNHLLVAAVGRALREQPQANRVWTDEGIVEFEGSDVGIAVDTGRGLLVPVLRDAGTLTIPELARAATDLVERTRAGTITAAQMAGGAITVSNAGMMNVTYMTPIINPGQAMVLGVGSVREVFRPDADGRPALRREIGLVLAADHRILSGAPALRLLNAVARHLEQPHALLAGRAR